MKKLFYLIPMLLVSFMTCMMTACGKDNDEPDDPSKPDEPTVVDPEQPVQDPASTVTVNILNNKENVSLGGVTVYMDEANNLCAYSGSYEESDLINIGSVAGLGNIVDIPTSGWKQKAVLNPGEGYIVRSRYYYGSGKWGPYTYARIYVISYLGSVEGAITGAQIKYQCPFQLPIKLSAKTVTFDAEGEGQVQTISLLNPTDVTVREQPEWLNITVSDLTITMTAAANYSANQRKGTVILGNDEGDVQVEVLQQASSDPFFNAGSGTAEDPYQIATAKQLDNVRKVSGCHFIQTADIDLSNYISSTGTGWEPIVGFVGSYNGQFHKIKGLWISKSSTDNVGLFGTIDDGDSPTLISRIILELGENGIVGRDNVGGIVGRMNSRSMIEMCSVTGNVSGGNHVGGISGLGYSNNNISRSKVEGNISGISDVAGVSGYDSPCGNCCVVGTVNATWNAYAISPSYNSTRCYIYNEGSNSPDVRGSYIVTWRASEENANMYKESSYEGFDFKEIWIIEEGKSLPELRCFK